jgi:hypothetical protein
MDRGKDSTGLRRRPWGSSEEQNEDGTCSSSEEPASIEKPVPTNGERVSSGNRRRDTSNMAEQDPTAEFLTVLRTTSSNVTMMPLLLITQTFFNWWMTKMSSSRSTRTTNWVFVASKAIQNIFAVDNFGKLFDCFNTWTYHTPIPTFDETCRPEQAEFLRDNPRFDYRVAEDSHLSKCGVENYGCREMTSDPHGLIMNPTHGSNLERH